MASVTSTDSEKSRKAAVAKSAGSAILGYVVPWSTPARAVATRVVRRHPKAVPTPARVTSATAAKRWIPAKRRSSRFSRRTGLVVVGLVGVVAGGVVFSSVRRGRHTPPPVAAHPPRVEDVPTR